MIPNTISKRVLTMGVDYHNPKGGIAQVLYAYSQIFETFRFIPTTNSKNFFSRQMTGIIAALKLLSLLLRKEIKIVHIHCASGKSFYRKSLYIFICQFFNVKILCHMHSGHFVRFIHKCPNFIRKTLLRCDSIIVLGHSWKNFYQNIGCQHIDIIDNIILPPQKIGEKKDDGLMHLIFLGSLTQPKGIYDLLQALGEYKSYLLGKIKLHIGGLGDLQTFQQEIDRLKIHEMVEYHGIVSDEAKNRLFTIGHIYKLPSNFEGMPISILEAMSYGMPIIASRTGGIPEIVIPGITGQLITAGHIEEIAESILWFLDHPEEKKEMAHIAQENSQKYLPQNIEKELTELYSRYL